MDIKRSTFLLLVAVSLIGVSSHLAAAQICPGSSLNYVVRDAKGVIVDAGKSDLKFEGTGSKETYTHWEAGPLKIMRSGQKLPELARFEGKVLLTNQAMCIFKEDVKLRITLGGQDMNLLFHMPALTEYASKDFVVDSVPFKAGAYEITLSAPENQGVIFYPASGWKKATSRSAAMAP